MSCAIAHVLLEHDFPFSKLLFAEKFVDQFEFGG